MNSLDPISEKKIAQACRQQEEIVKKIAERNRERYRDDWKALQ